MREFTNGDLYLSNVQADARRAASCRHTVLELVVQPMRLWREGPATAAKSGYMPSPHSFGGFAAGKAGTFAALPLTTGQLAYFLLRRDVESRDAMPRPFWAEAGATQMARLLLARMASVAALVSTSVVLNGCWTIAGRPIFCDFGLSLKDGRCAKVTKASTPRRDKSNSKRGNSHY